MIKHFTESFLKGLPWILAAIGIIFILVAILAVEENGVAHKILLTLGEAILVGGVFAVLLKSMQYLGVFKEELEKVIYNDEFLSIRNDLDSLWRKVTAAIYKKKFPQLSSSLHETIMNEYLPTGKKYYYKDYHRNAKVEWGDEKKQVLVATEQIAMTIIPVDSVEQVIYKFEYSAPKGDGERSTTQELIEFTINGKPYDSKNEFFLKEEYKDEHGTEFIKYFYNIPLEGSKEYKIFRVVKKHFCLDLDPYSRYYSETFILGSKVKVRVESDDIKVQFISLGTTKDYDDVGLRPAYLEKRQNIDKEFAGLLFPRQGYVLYYSQACNINHSNGD